jgi:predicted AAA+ superfamily ATPase
MRWLRLYRGQPLIKILTGIRRCGKSTLLGMVRDEIAASGAVPPEQIVSLNFEDMAHRDKLTADSLYDHLRSVVDFAKPFYVFLDEIQNVAEFERVLDSLFVQPSADIYVTGSNARFLSDDLATLLTGRYIEIRVFPLSFAEYVSSFETPPTDLGRAYQDYVTHGSLPEAVNLRRRLGAEAASPYLRGVLDTILFKDIAPRHGIKDVAKLQDVVAYIFDGIANITNPKRIADYLTSQHRGTSSHTVENYLSALANAFLAFPVSRFDIRGKALLQTLKKYYIADPAFRVLLADAPPSDYGRVLENVVALELMRRYEKVWIGKNRDKEIDFVVRSVRGEYAYYQVAQTVRDTATLERELAAFPTGDHYPKTLLTLDIEEGTHNGIKQQNAINWLLEK